jgi:hypothetical protein
MQRKQRHTLIFVGTTLVFLIVAGFTFTQELGAKNFLIWIASYFVFLLLYGLICRLDVPKQLRQRPERPDEFDRVRLGSPTPETIRLIESSEVTKREMFSGIEHVLYRVEREFPNGKWICEIEIAGGQILARDIAYESVASPILDLHARIGDGRFLVSLS